MRRVAVLVGVFCLTTAALGAVTAVHIETPDPPYIVGQTLEFQIVSNGNVQNEWMDYRCIQGGATPTWVKSSSHYIVQRFVGNKEFKGVTEEMNQGASGPTTTHELTKQITVIGPDSDDLAFGLRVPSTGWPKMHVECHFLCLASGIQMAGADVAVVKAEERIRRIGPGGGDSGWVGAAGEFYWDTRVIIDNKFVEVVDPVVWNNIAIGQAFDFFYQQNRIIIKDCFGAEQTYYFEERYLRKVKVNATSWQLERA